MLERSLRREIRCSSSGIMHYGCAGALRRHWEQYVHRKKKKQKKKLLPAWELCLAPAFLIRAFLHVAAMWRQWSGRGQTILQSSISQIIHTAVCLPVHLIAGPLQCSGCFIYLLAQRTIWLGMTTLSTPSFPPLCGVLRDPYETYSIWCTLTSPIRWGRKVWSACLGSAVSACGSPGCQ